MKTPILFVAMLAVAVLCLAACGPAPETPATQAAPATTSPSSEAPATQIATATTGPTATSEPAGTPLEQVWSITGDPNPFDTPDGVAVDQQDNLYVMDSGNNRIQKFDSDGHFITMWGSTGHGNAQFDCRHICMVAADAQGHVYITDQDNARVQIFDSDGKFLAKLGSFGNGDGQFYSPFGIAVDGQGDVFVTDALNARVQEFDGNGKFLLKWGSSGHGDGQFSSDLADIAVDAQGNIYVTDRSNGIAKFDSSGHFLAKLDMCGEKRIHSAAGVAFDHQGNLYVSDASDVSKGRICQYDGNGQFLNWWDGAGSPEGPITAVGGIAVDQHGNIYVGELFSGRVRKFRQH